MELQGFGMFLDFCFFFVDGNKMLDWLGVGLYDEKCWLALQGLWGINEVVAL
jgi:hypothetical protein